MRGERRLLRTGEYLIARACRHLPAEARDERYREWAAELPAILQDPDVRPAARRAARMLRYASGTIRGTALTPGSARRVMAHTAGTAATFIATLLVCYLLGYAKNPREWPYIGIGFLLGRPIASGGRLAYRAYRRKRGKGPGEDLTAAVETQASVGPGPGPGPGPGRLHPAGKGIRRVCEQHGGIHRRPFPPPQARAGLPRRRGG